MENTQILPDSTVEVVDIQFRPGQKIYFFSPDGEVYQNGDHVIIDTARGAEFGYCVGGNHRIPQRDVVSPLRCVLRKANAQDEKIHEENRSKEKRAFEVCSQKILEHNLEMQLVSAECAFDGSKILFYFTADERVDFRELVKNLASVFHTRIELRQIGVRDKAKMVGGLGICGRPFCCASFLDDFQPVSIKMAKTQNLSLNPTKISGTCGRLMCCLKYEQEAYEDLIRNSPKADSFVDTPEGRGTIIEIDLMCQRVKVRMEEDPDVISVFSNSDIAVLRSGKAKKNDPPIPADLAPISGGKRRVKKESLEETAFLEPIRFRYSTEAVVAEPVKEEPVEIAEHVEETPAAEPKPHRSRRRHKGEKAENKEANEPKEGILPPKAEKKPTKAEKKVAVKPVEKKPESKPEKKTEKATQAPEGTQETDAPKRRRRPHHHRHRKPKPQGEG